MAEDRAAMKARLQKLSRQELENLYFESLHKWFLDAFENQGAFWAAEIYRRIEAELDGDLEAINGRLASRLTFALVALHAIRHELPRGSSAADENKTPGARAVHAITLAAVGLEAIFIGDPPELPADG